MLYLVFQAGRTDNIMMRFVDVINSVPLVLIHHTASRVMLPRGSGGLWTIILSR